MTTFDLQHDLAQLSYIDRFELGKSAAENESQDLHLTDNIWFRHSEQKNLQSFDGLDITDYSWSFVVNGGAEVEAAAYIIGAMRMYGFQFVGLVSTCWPGARDNCDNSGCPRIGETFELKVKFYPTKPGPCAAPKLLYNIDETPIEEICNMIADEKDINDIRLALLLKVEPFLSDKTAPEVIEKISKHGWNHDGFFNEETGKWSEGSHFLYTDENGQRHDLDDYKNGVVLVDNDNFPTAVGPDAVLMA